MTAVAVAPDGSWLASGSGDRRVRIWDVATGQARATLKGHTGPVEAVAVAPDSSWLAYGCWRARPASSRRAAQPTVAPSRARVPVSARAISRSVGYPAKPCR